MPGFEPETGALLLCGSAAVDAEMGSLLAMTGTVATAALGMVGCSSMVVLDKSPSTSSSSSSSSSSSIHEDYNLPSSSTSATFPSAAHPPKSRAVIKEILAEDDLYKVLGINRASPADRLTLRRAYLSRSKSCHPE